MLSYAVWKAAMVGDETAGSGWIGRAARLGLIRWHCDQCVNDGVPVFSQTLIYRIRVLIGIGSAVWFGRLRGRGVVVRVHVGGSTGWL